MTVPEIDFPHCDNVLVEYIPSYGDFLQITFDVNDPKTSTKCYFVDGEITKLSVQWLNDEQIKFASRVVELVKQHGEMVVIDHYCRLMSIKPPAPPEGYFYRATNLNEFQLVKNGETNAVAHITQIEPQKIKWQIDPFEQVFAWDNEQLSFYLSVVEAFNAITSKEPNHDA